MVSVAVFVVAVLLVFADFVRSLCAAPLVPCWMEGRNGVVVTTIEEKNIKRELRFKHVCSYQLDIFEDVRRGDRSTNAVPRVVREEDDPLPSSTAIRSGVLSRSCMRSC